ncbi:exosortase A system-associated hydrolase 1 [Nitrosomonas aestuarii]|uniref:Exosortase A system-associated hydrolase 1 n=1 Tax=Nitrosomonas aestuarii TaxID=52441 RepID=A0A1I4CSE0_9PROT|nr:hydrolase 1, exosortase A system-associated [Nitrosomonas aestuarii]SFK83703.1 exosortase A system-associated hydrolase 1 [Nitrosomonas aestuarii]
MLPNQSEQPVSIPCEGETLIGIVNKPVKACRTGVVIIVAGGPQYRVGAHRQFVTLARLLAGRGIASIRFDHRGTGDSTGELRGFIDMNADIQSAIDTLFDRVPEIEKVVLWGECESATASAFFSYLDTRVQGIFMVNPWIRTDVGLAKTIIKHYYWQRIMQKSFWKKVMSGKFSATDSLKSIVKMMQSIFTRPENVSHSEMSDNFFELPLPERLAKSCEKFQGQIFILTSGFDFIAREFKDYLKSSEIWQKIIASGQVTLKDIPDADHTFSRLEWRKELLDQTVDWIMRLDSKRNNQSM